MRLHRFIGEYDISKKTIRIEDAEFMNQTVNVLRLRINDELILVERGVGEARCKINAINDEFVEIEVLDRSPARKESIREITLYCSILKRENFEFAVQKATESGVTRIVPILAARTVKLNINEERLKKIASEAAEQSGRITVPEIAPMMTLAASLKNVKAHNDTVVLFDGTGAQMHVSNFKIGSRIAIYVGPEGGWEESEVSTAAEAGVEVLNLGPLTLRAETAAIIGTYLLCQQKND